MENVERLVKQTGEWLKGSGPDSDIVLSSRIRLARNIEGITFPAHANHTDTRKSLELSLKALSDLKELDNHTTFRMKDISSLDRQVLVERHLMSKEHSEKPESRALFLTTDERFSVMINEEDHMRMQLMKSGFALIDIWKEIDGIDTKLSGKIPYAFRYDLGYLTSCPTNTGTAMRSSCMLHLPGLVMSGQIKKILQIIAKLSFTARGFYGEGTEAIGNFFQISNQVCLGQSEVEIIDNLNGLIRQIIDQERSARDFMSSKDGVILEDRVYRALGILKSARSISSKETLELLSLLRLGLDLGLVENIPEDLVNVLFIIVQPAHLQKFEKRNLSSIERDKKRANILRDRLKNTSK